MLPASVVLPDVSDPAGRDAAIATLESRLGRDLPDDFALIQVADANRLATAQSAVRAFDIATDRARRPRGRVHRGGGILLSGRRLRMAALLADRHRRLAPHRPAARPRRARGPHRLAGHRRRRHGPGHHHGPRRGSRVLDVDPRDRRASSRAVLAVIAARPDWVRSGSHRGEARPTRPTTGSAHGPTPIATGSPGPWASS